MYLQVAHGTILACLEVLHNTAFTNYRTRTDETFSPKPKNFDIPPPSLARSSECQRFVKINLQQTSSSTNIYHH